jgi:hypothetical protein
MPIFGGDPRFVHLEILLHTNIWYDVMVLPLFVLLQLQHSSEAESMLIMIPFILFELIRISLHAAHRKGDIPLYVAFLMLTVAPLFILDILWIGASPTATGLDIAAMVGYLVQHFLQLAFCTSVYRNFKAYQGGFYQFARGMQRRGDELAVELEASIE